MAKTDKIKEDINLPVIPIGDKIVVELVMEAISAGGIALPDKVAKSGFVRAIAKGIPDMFKDDVAGRGLRVGDKVHLPRGENSGEKFDMEGKKFILMSAQFISGVLPS